MSRNRAKLLQDNALRFPFMGLSEQNHGSGDNRRGMSLGQAQLEFEPEFVTRHNLSLGQSHFDDRHILAVTDLLG